MELLESKFKSINESLSSLKLKIHADATNVAISIEKCIVFKPLEDHINVKRGLQMDYLNVKLAKIMQNVNKLVKKSAKYKSYANFRNLFFNNAHRSYYKKQLQYLKSKYDTDNVTDLVGQLNFGHVLYRNELSVYKKFFYFHICQNEITRRRCPPEYRTCQYECFFISKQKYLIQDLERKELVLLNRKHIPIHKITIKNNYSISLSKILNSRIILILYNATTNQKYICLLDFELRVLKCRKMHPTQMLINFGPNNIFFQQSLKSKSKRSTKILFIVLDLDLNVVDTLDARPFKEKYFVDTNRTHLFNVIGDRVLIKDFMDTNFYNIKIVSKTTGELIQTINNLNYFINRINYFVKIDAEMNIYVINTCKEEATEAPNTLAYLFCYNSSGKLMFKRYIPFLNECYYIDFVSDNTISFNYLDEVDLF